MICKMSYVPLKAENCMHNVKKNQNFIVVFFFHNYVVVVALLFYVHGKHLRSCRDGQ